jgi:hypothetical protein
VEDYGLHDEPHALAVLRMACEALDRADEARKVLDRDGLTVAGTGGTTKTHPAVAVEHDSAVRAARLFRELSLDGGDPDDFRIARTNGARS